jgi:hypothetical protein
MCIKPRQTEYLYLFYGIMDEGHGTPGKPWFAKRKESTFVFNAFLADALHRLIYRGLCSRLSGFSFGPNKNNGSSSSSSIGAMAKVV